MGALESDNFKLTCRRQQCTSLSTAEMGTTHVSTHAHILAGCLRLMDNLVASNRQASKQAIMAGNQGKRHLQDRQTSYMTRPDTTTPTQLADLSLSRLPKKKPPPKKKNNACFYPSPMTDEKRSRTRVCIEWCSVPSMNRLLARSSLSRE